MVSIHGALSYSAQLRCLPMYTSYPSYSSLVFFPPPRVLTRLLSVPPCSRPYSLRPPCSQLCSSRPPRVLRDHAVSWGEMVAALEGEFSAADDAVPCDVPYDVSDVPQDRGGRGGGVGTVTTDRGGAVRGIGRGAGRGVPSSEESLSPQRKSLGRRSSGRRRRRRKKREATPAGSSGEGRGVRGVRGMGNGVEGGRSGGDAREERGEARRGVVTKEERRAHVGERLEHPASRRGSFFGMTRWVREKGVEKGRRSSLGDSAPTVSPLTTTVRRGQSRGQGNGGGRAWRGSVSMSPGIPVHTNTSRGRGAGGGSSSSSSSRHL